MHGCFAICLVGVGCLYAYIGFSLSTKKCLLYMSILLCHVHADGGVLHTCHVHTCKKVYQLLHASLTMKLHYHMHVHTEQICKQLVA